MIKYLILSVLFLFVASCQEKVYDLDMSKAEKIAFQDLPIQVSYFISSNIDSIVNSQRDVFYSTDSSVEFTYGRGGVAKNWLGSISSNYHHFFIDGVHYRLKGNRGHPFVLHEEYLFFCELNIYEDDFIERPYFKIRVPSIR